MRKIRKEILLDKEVEKVLQSEAEKKKWSLRVYIENLVTLHYNKIIKYNKVSTENSFELNIPELTYIHYINGTIISTHPSVELIWTYGYCNDKPNSEGKNMLSILLKDGTRTQFEFTKSYSCFTEADNYLKTIPIINNENR